MNRWLFLFLFVSVALLGCSESKDETPSPSIRVIAPSVAPAGMDIPVTVVVTNAENHTVTVRAPENGALWDTVWTPTISEDSVRTELTPDSGNTLIPVEIKVDGPNGVVHFSFPIQITPLVFQVNPRNSAAPLRQLYVSGSGAAHNPHEPLALDFEGDGVFDTTFSLPTDGGVIQFYRNFPLGDYHPTLRSEHLFHNQQYVYHVLDVSLYNTPPHLTSVLPTLNGIEDNLSSLSDMFLRNYLTDSLSGSDSLVFEVFEQSGPAIWIIHGDTLGVESMLANQNGNGVVTVRATDPQGLFTDVDVNYFAEPRTDVRIRPQDVVSETALDSTRFTINGTVYTAGPQGYDIEVLPGTVIQLQGWGVSPSGPTSFGRSTSFTTIEDTIVNLLMVPYSRIGGQTPQVAREVNRQGRLSPGTTVMNSIDFENAHLGYGNGGYTYIIADSSQDGLWRFTPAFKDTLVSRLTNMLGVYAPNERPQIHVLQPGEEDPVWQGGLSEGILYIVPSSYSGISTDITAGDGKIHFAYINLPNNAPRNHVYQECGSAINMPQEVGMQQSIPIPTNATVYHYTPTVSQFTALDSTSADVARKIGRVPLNDVWYIPGN